MFVGWAYPLPSLLVEEAQTLAEANERKRSELRQEERECSYPTARSVPSLAVVQAQSLRLLRLQADSRTGRQGSATLLVPFLQVL